MMEFIKELIKENILMITVFAFTFLIGCGIGATISEIIYKEDDDDAKRD